MEKTVNLQEMILAKVKKEAIEVSIFLISGIKLQGVIESYDDDVIWFNNVSSQMIYKHAISTIVPSKYIQL